MKTSAALVFLWIIGGVMVFVGIVNLANMEDYSLSYGFTGAALFTGGAVCIAAALAVHAIRASLTPTPDAPPAPTSTPVV